jgi:hypothetical protein
MTRQYNSSYFKTIRSKLASQTIVANLVAPLDDLNEIVSFKVILYNSIFIIL